MADNEQTCSWIQVHAEVNDNNAAEYVVEEYSRDAVNVEYIVYANNLPDNDASSTYDDDVNHLPKRARFDNYFDRCCGWAANRYQSHRLEWFKISLLDQYRVIGVHIRRRCESFRQYSTVVDVTTSVDDVLWKDVVKAEDIATRYSFDDKQGSVSVWFSRSYTTQHWKIYIVDYRSAPAMKCDLIGHAN